MTMLEAAISLHPLNSKINGRPLVSVNRQIWSSESQSSIIFQRILKGTVNGANFN